MVFVEMSTQLRGCFIWLPGPYAIYNNVICHRRLIINNICFLFIVMRFYTTNTRQPGTWMAVLLVILFNFSILITFLQIKFSFLVLCQLSRFDIKYNAFISFTLPSNISKNPRITIQIQIIANKDLNKGSQGKTLGWSHDNHLAKNNI